MLHVESRSCRGDLVGTGDPAAHLRDEYGRMQVSVHSETEVLSGRYAEWQQRLESAFFDDHADQPVVLFVDRDELTRLSAPDEDGARSLAAAVRDLVDVGSTARMFTKVEMLQNSWLAAGCDGPPPTLPVLALSVLAASEMRRDSQNSSNSYYIRLAEVLLPDGTDSDVRMLRQRLREGSAFLPVVAMWEYLAVWLDETDGAYGTSTVRGHERDKRRGYPLSQTLVRRSERAALSQFFAQAQLRPGDVPAAETLLNWLERWMRYRSHGLSEQFEAALGDEELRPFLAQLVHDLATAWDGKIITSEGLRSLGIRLAVDLDDARAWWVIPSVNDVSADLLRGSANGMPFEATIATDPHTSMYHAENLPEVTPSTLTAGFTARGNRAVAEFEPRKVFVLTLNADAGGWVSVDAIQPYEEHAFIVAADAVGQITAAVEAAADKGWRPLPGAFAQRLIGPGFAVFDRLMFSDQDRLDDLLKALPSTVSADLRRGATLRPRLIKGLPLMRHLTDRLYLSGGEPDLLLPFDETPRMVDVALDNRHGTLKASLFSVPFHNFTGGFTEGAHTISANGETLTFEVARTSGNHRIPPGTGSIGWSRGHLQEVESAEICGAITTDGPTDTPVLARRRSIESWLLFRTGRMQSLADPPEPTVLPGLRFSMFEVAPQGAAWLVQKRATGWRAIRLQAQEPAFQPLGPDEQRVWAEVCAAVRHPDPLWQLYARAWERTRGC